MLLEVKKHLREAAEREQRLQEAAQDPKLSEKYIAAVKERDSFKEQVGKLKRELDAFDPAFFEEIEDLKYNYEEALKKNVQYEEQLSSLRLEGRACEGAEPFEQKGEIDNLVASLKTQTTSIIVHARNTKDGETPWFPRKIHEKDRFANQILSYGSELDSDHPPLAPLGTIKCSHPFDVISWDIMGPLPSSTRGCKYILVITDLFSKWVEAFPLAATDSETLASVLVDEVVCRLSRQEAEDSTGEANVPQYVEELTHEQSKKRYDKDARGETFAVGDQGFTDAVYRARRKYFANIAYNYRYDVCHELLGHAPLFCDPDFARFSQEIGLASLGAPDNYIEQLATSLKQCSLVECSYHHRYTDSPLSLYCLSDKPEVRPLDPFKTALQKYPITEMQPVYFLAESFQDAQEKIVEFSRTIPRPFAVHYNPYTQTAEILNTKTSLLQNMARDLKHELSVLDEGLQKVSAM
eukprot:Em0020g248a